MATHFLKLVLLTIKIGSLIQSIDGRIREMEVSNEISRVWFCDSRLYFLESGAVWFTDAKTVSNKSQCQCNKTETFSVLQRKGSSVLMTCATGNGSLCYDVANGKCGKETNYPIVLGKNNIFIQNNAVSTIAISGNSRIFWSRNGKAIDTISVKDKKLSISFIGKYINGAQTFFLSTVKSDSSTSSISLFQVTFSPIRKFLKSCTEDIISKSCGMAKAVIPFKTTRNVNYYLSTSGNICKICVFSESKCGDDDRERFKRRFEASFEIGKCSGDECTLVTRKDLTTECKTSSVEKVTLKGYNSTRPVSAMRVGKYLVIGLSTGVIEKYLMSSDNDGELQYSNKVASDNTAVHVQESNGEFVFGVLKQPGSSPSVKIFKIGIHDCHDYLTCDSCFNGDPICVWCPFLNKCVADVEQTCSGKVKNKESCPVIKPVAQKVLPTDFKSQVQVQFDKLTAAFPTDSEAKCLWFLPTGREVFTNGIAENRTISCLTPIIDFLPSNQMNVTMITMFHEDNLSAIAPLVNQNMTFTFYNCPVFKSCTSCTRGHDLTLISGGKFRCGWINAFRPCGSELRSRPKRQCAVISSSPQPQVSSVLTSEVVLKGSNLPVSETAFQCRINKQNFSLHIINTTTAKCQNVRLTGIDANTAFYRNISIEVISDKFNIDAENGQPVKGWLYDCSKERTCSNCLYYQSIGCHCQWSESDKSCANQKGGRQISTICGSPTVTQISPSDGPIQGNTEVTIRGTNLGSSKAEVDDKIKMGGIDCEFVKAGINSVVCTTGKASMPFNSQLKIRGHDMGRTFEYKIVVIEGLSRLHCFTNLNSTLNIVVSNFNIGSKRRLSFDTNNLCTNSTTWSKLTDKTYQVQCPQCHHHNTKMMPGNLKVQVDGYIDNKAFKFLPFPTLIQQVNKGSIQSGGVTIQFKSNFAVPVNLKMFLSKSGKRTASRNCTWPVDSDKVTCMVPTLTLTNQRSKRDVSTNDQWQIGFTADPNGDITGGRPNRFKLIVYPDPRFKNISIKSHSVLKKFNVYSAQQNSSLTDGARESDFVLRLGIRNFTKAKLYKDVVMFDVSDFPDEEFNKPLSVKIFVGVYFSQELGSIEMETSNATSIIIAVFMVVLICLLIGGAVVFSVRRAGDLKLKTEKRKFEQHLDKITAETATAARNAFTAMQTSMFKLSLDNDTTLPYREFEDFITYCLVPSRSGVLMPPVAFDEIPFKSSFISSQVTDEMVRSFDSELLVSKPFILTLIRTFDKCVRIKERTLLASAVSIALINRLDYCYEIINNLLQNVVSCAVADRKIDSLQLLFRGSDYLVEKIYANWLTICLYSQLRNSENGRRFYVVCKALDTYINQGPVDSFTNRATNVLSEELLLVEEMDFQVIPITASIEDEDEGDHIVSLEILSQDSISQVKNKIIEAFYLNQPFSIRPSGDQFQLVWKRTSNRSTNSDTNGREKDAEAGQKGRAYYINFDNDTRGCDAKTKQIFTIGYFNNRNILENAHLVLRARALMRRIQRQQSGQPGTSMAGSLASVASVTDSTALLEVDDERERWHLCKPIDQADMQISKDFLLPHILKTKEVIKPYVDDLFKSIFHVDDVKEPPQCVWHMFRILDDLVQMLPKDRPCSHANLLHVWKSNTFILRVWFNLLKNPHFLFDVDNPPTLNTSLSTIAQALMDCCSLNIANATTYKSLPMNKVIYMKDVEQYRKWVADFYNQVATNPNAPSQQDLSIMLHELNQQNCISEDILFKAKRFLFVYARQYKAELLTNINSSPWLYTDEEKQELTARVETILQSNETTSVV